ncbi:hypothetical protein BDZ91DRAFT_728657, partial [Kalaharituber pfeilii]
TLARRGCHIYQIQLILYHLVSSGPAKPVKFSSVCLLLCRRVGPTKPVKFSSFCMISYRPVVPAIVPDLAPSGQAGYTCQI